MSISDHKGAVAENSKQIYTLNSVAPSLAQELKKINELDFGLLRAIHQFLVWINVNSSRAEELETELKTLHEKYRQARVLREVHFYEYQVQNPIAISPSVVVNTPPALPNVNVTRQGNNGSEEFRVVKGRGTNGLILTHTIYKSLFSATQRSSMEIKFKRKSRCDEAGDIYRKL